MVDKAIPALTPAGVLDGTEEVHLIQSTNSRRSTAQDIADLATVTIQDESLAVGSSEFFTLDFVGAGVTVTDAGSGTATITIPGGGGGGSTIITQDEGTPIDAAATTINFVGAGVTATDAGAGVTTVTIPGGGGGSSIIVEDEGVSLTTAVTKFNFAGAGVTVTEPVANEVLVTIPGGGGGGGSSGTRFTDSGATSGTLDIPLPAGDVTSYRLVGYFRGTFSSGNYTRIRVTEDNFTSAVSTTSYRWALSEFSLANPPAIVESGAGPVGEIRLHTPGVGISSGDGVWIDLTITSAGDANLPTIIHGRVLKTDGTDYFEATISATYDVASVVNGIQLSHVVGSFIVWDLFLLETGAGGGSSGVITQDEGVEVDAAATTLNFIGHGVEAVDAGGGVTNINIPPSIPDGGNGATDLFDAQSAPSINSSSSFAFKGNIYTMADDRWLTDVFFPLDSGVVAQRVDLFVARLSDIDPGTIAEVLVDVGEVSVLNPADSTQYSIPNGGLRLVSGNIYVIAFVRTDASPTSVLRINFPSGAGNSNAFFTYGGAARAARNAPAVSDATFFSNTAAADLNIQTEGYVAGFTPLVQPSNFGNGGKYLRLNDAENLLEWDGFTTREVTASETLLATDFSGLTDTVVVNSGTDVILTIPAGLTPTKTLTVFRKGAGEVDIAADVGVTILSEAGNLSIDAQYNAATLLPTGTADEYALVGKLKA